MDARCLEALFDGRRLEADSGSREQETTYRGDSASSRDGADGASRLSEGVPEHIKRGMGGLEMKGEQLQQGAIGGRGDWGVRCCLCRRANGDF